MPKGDEKYKLSDKLIQQYPELKNYLTKNGRLNKNKKLEILQYITDKDDKNLFIKVFDIKGVKINEVLTDTDSNSDELSEDQLNELLEGEDIIDANEILDNENSNIRIDKDYIHSKGQYFTKNKLLQKYVIEFILNKPKIILEPSIGRGDLIKCVSDKFNVDFYMCEIDKNIELLDGINKDNVIYDDFMKIKIDSNFDTIIGNPPYVKTKKGNLYIDFIEKCYNLLNDKGELIFIVPSDFFKLTSSNKLLSEMISNGNFTHIYHPHKENLFENASIDVIVFRYCKDNTLEKTTLYNNEKKYLVESSGLITFSNEKIIMDKKLSDYFEISVGMVCGRENVYRNKEIGNLDLLSGKDSYTKYIYIDKFPSDDIKINEHLLKNKDDLINRRIRKFNENNWFEWGAPRNINKMKKYKGQDCIYVKGISRSEKIAFIGKVDYFGGLIMMRPIKKCNLEKIVDYLNSENFKNNFMYSGRFKIGHRQLCNSYFP